MKKHLAKMRLHRETLRHLSMDQLQRAPGADTVTCMQTPCTIQDSCAICTYGGDTCFRICDFSAFNGC